MAYAQLLPGNDQHHSCMGIFIKGRCVNNRNGFIDMADQRRMTKRERLTLNIQSGMLVDRMLKCALGEIKMTSGEIRCGEILLKKTIPDLKSVEKTNVNKSLRDMSNEDILNEIERQLAELESARSDEN